MEYIIQIKERIQKFKGGMRGVVLSLKFSFQECKRMKMRSKRITRRAGLWTSHFLHIADSQIFIIIRNFKIIIVCGK